MERHTQVVPAQVVPAQVVAANAVSATTGGLPVAAVARALIIKPGLWLTAVRAGLSLAETGWWHRRPFLPVPSQDWLHFRLVTAYGGDGTELRVEDLITWLEWRKRWPG